MDDYVPLDNELQSGKNIFDGHGLSFEILVGHCAIFNMG